MKTVLLLGGTGEARALAQAFVSAFAASDIRLIASLAGATAHPRAYPCAMRHGGFGGVSGLRGYLRDKGIVAVIDATHPFATRMSANAVRACAAEQVPQVALIRPPWLHIGEWHPFDTVERALDAIGPGARVLATTGRKDIVPYVARPDLTVFLRSVDPPDVPPSHIVPLVAREPFTVEAEIETMTCHGITHLLTRNAGGESRARLDAAVTLGLPLHIVERPDPPDAPVLHTVADALRWAQDVLRD